MEYTPKTDKITRILTLYNKLINGQCIDKTVFSLEHGINERSFDRDIEDIRLFLSDIFSARELVFDKGTSSYYLTGDKPSFLERMDATIIAKLIISSKTLRQDEMEGLFEILLSTVTPHDADAVRTHLHRDIARYASITQSAILKTVEDLYVVIQSGTDIELTICSEDGNEKVKVSPLEIDITDGVLFLVGAVDMQLSAIQRYRLDNILSFRRLSSTFAKNLKDDYFLKP